MKYARPVLLLLIPLTLSAFTHLWNPVGFPTLHVDEGHYMRRTMQVLEGLGPQESTSTYDFPYDHPYFGQLFLAGALSLINYPDFLNPSDNLHSIEMLYLVPRVLMGLLAIFDTFLVYQIAGTKYNRKVAIISATLFAVMPMGWMLRGIFLDSIQLPFLLLSILFALYYAKRSASNYEHNSNKGSKKNIMLILLSGTFLGIAIFTKIPVFTMIPLIVFIILKNSNGSISKTKSKLKSLGIWFIPVILIPMIWPAYAISAGQFDEWLDGVIYQAVREWVRNLRSSILLISQFDPILLVVSAAGIIYSVIRKDYFILLWALPYLVFLYGVGWVTHFHWILLMPVLCIASSILIEDLIKIFRSLKVSRLIEYGIILSILIPGFVITSMLITSNLNSVYFNVYLLVVREIGSHDKGVSHQDPINVNSDFASHGKVEIGVDGEGGEDGLTLIGSHRTRALVWIPKYVFNSDFVFRDTDLPKDNFTKPIQTNNFILVADSNLFTRLTGAEYIIKYPRERTITSLYYNTSDTIATFINKANDKYDFLNLRENHGFGSFIEIRANY